MYEKTGKTWLADTLLHQMLSNAIKYSHTYLRESLWMDPNRQGCHCIQPREGKK